MFKLMDNIDNDTIYTILVYVVLICVFFLAELSWEYSVAIILLFVIREYQIIYFTYKMMIDEFKITPEQIMAAYEKSKNKLKK